jgi:hypothetical protein
MGRPAGHLHQHHDSNEDVDIVSEARRLALARFGSVDFQYRPDALSGSTSGSGSGSGTGFRFGIHRNDRVGSGVHSPRHHPRAAYVYLELIPFNSFQTPHQQGH